MTAIAKRWRCADGREIRVMCEPVEGYVLARFKGAMPFAIALGDLLNANRRPHKFGPFECLDRAESTRSQEDN